MKTFIVFAMLMGLCGCGSLAKPYPDKNLYALRIGDPPAAPAAPARAVIRIDQVNLAPPYDSTGFIYQMADSRFTSDYYNGFIAPPARLLGGELGGFLTKSGLFSAVLTGDSSANYQLALEANVTSMYGDYRSPDKPQAIVTVRIFVIDQAHGRFDVIFDKPYSESEAVSGKGPEALVKAWETCWTRLLTKFAGDLRDTPAVMTAGTTEPQPATQTTGSEMRAR